MAPTIARLTPPETAVLLELLDSAVRGCEAEARQIEAGGSSRFSTAPHDVQLSSVPLLRQRGDLLRSIRSKLASEEPAPRSEAPSA